MVVTFFKYMPKPISLPRDARSASAVLLSYVVRPSVYLSVRDVDVPWAYRLDQFEINYRNN